ncbi:MAG: TetR/AcrR family transcriptional regulator [Cyanobacteriota bacterium]|nr:TetR/AcrR family transcriptional regulator [Cyanobacteriota bacterium]
MQDQVDARERLLNAAEKLFRDKGYNAVTMQDVAKEVGIRQASLYYHITSKEQLFVEVIERICQRHHIGLEQKLQMAEANLQSQLRAATEWFTSQPPLHLFSLMHSDLQALSEANFQQLFASLSQSVFAPLMQIFVTAQQQGEIRPVAPSTLAGYFLAVMDSAAFSNTRWGSTAAREVIAEEMVSILVDGLRPRST